jgi:hypothetical protein
MPNIQPEFGPWIDDPDEPDRMTEAEMDRMVDGFAKMFPHLVKKPPPPVSKFNPNHEPGGSPQGGQFTSGSGGGGGTTASGKSKKPAQKADFDKAKIQFGSEEKVVIEKWNDKIGMEPEEFKKSFLGGTAENSTMTVSMEGSRFNIQGAIHDASGKTVGEYQREVDPDKKYAYSAYFKLNKSTTGHNIGKQILGGNIATYEKLGIETVGVSANIDVGGYAWAKYGYVPTPAAWADLRGRLEQKLGRGPSSPSRSGVDTYEADDWEMLSSDQQERAQASWMRNTASEFLDSEIENWRDNGWALEEAKRDLVHQFNASHQNWAADAVQQVMDDRAANGESPIPYDAFTLEEAIKIGDYEGRYGDGRDDPTITFDDSKLLQPTNASPGQGELPGIEPPDLSKRLTQDMRDQLESEMIAAFNKQAEKDAGDAEPPDYLGDSVSEYQGEVWDNMSDRERLRHAIDSGNADIEVEPDEDEEAQPEPPKQTEMKLPTPADELLAAVRSSDPKSIWKIADSSRGKELLLNTNWSGKLNLKDPESYDRFKKYVGGQKAA